MDSMLDAGTEERIAEKSTGELINDLTTQLSHLARTEVQLAMREGREKVRHAGVGAVTSAVSGVLAFYGGAAVLAGVVLLLALAVPAWTAALIVGAVVLAVAGVGALIARGQPRRSAPMPSASVESAKEDLHMVREATKR